MVHGQRWRTLLRGARVGRWGLLGGLQLAVGLSGACSGSDGATSAGDVPGAGTGTGGSGATSGSGRSIGALFAPRFPGAGTAPGAGQPLQNGTLCDYVPAKDELPTPAQQTTCFFDQAGDPVPAATLEQVLECVEGQDVVHLRLTFNPDFVDNTYGTGSIGWPQKRGHTMRDLDKSDHAELLIQDGDGDVVLQFKLDYISPDDSTVSGYGQLGVTGGDGNVTKGEADWVLDTNTSLARNLNERGYDGYTVDSPPTDEDFTPSAEAPDWDYRVVYEAWIDVAALGNAGFGGAYIEYVHASPAKAENDMLEVEPGECPPEFCVNPDGCGEGVPPVVEEPCIPGPDDACEEGEPGPPPSEEDPCGDQPDEFCEGGGPEPGTREFCELYPDDPTCYPE